MTKAHHHAQGQARAKTRGPIGERPDREAGVYRDEGRGWRTERLGRNRCGGKNREQQRGRDDRKHRRGLGSPAACRVDMHPAIGRRGRSIRARTQRRLWRLRRSCQRHSQHDIRNTLATRPSQTVGSIRAVSAYLPLAGQQNARYQTPPGQTLARAQLVWPVCTHDIDASFSDSRGRRCARSRSHPPPGRRRTPPPPKIRWTMLPEGAC